MLNILRSLAMACWATAVWLNLNDHDDGVVLELVDVGDGIKCEFIQPLHIILDGVRGFVFDERGPIK